MGDFLSSAELKGLARDHLFGKYGAAIGAYVLMHLLLFTFALIVSTAVPSTAVGSIIGYVIDFIEIIVIGVFNSGLCYMYLNISCGNQVSSGMIFYGFSAGADKALLIQLVITLCQGVTAIPLGIAVVLYINNTCNTNLIMLIAGFVIFTVGVVYFTIQFLPAFYLLHDFPGYSTGKILSESIRLMKGSRLRALYIYVSLLPLKLLGLISLGVGNLWVQAYQNTTLAEFFLDLMKKQSVSENNH